MVGDGGGLSEKVDTFRYICLKKNPAGDLRDYSGTNGEIKCYQFSTNRSFVSLQNVHDERIAVGFVRLAQGMEHS
jgi:hypothetical protein